MQNMQRRFGKLLPRTADESQVSVLLKDFEDADRMLTKVSRTPMTPPRAINTKLPSKLIDAAKAWRDSWRDILSIQHRLVSEFHSMYNPIIGAGEGYSGYEPALTPQSTLDRVTKLQEAYAELTTDLLEEINVVDVRLIKPATEAKDWLQPMKKVIKKRQDRKVGMIYMALI